MIDLVALLSVDTIFYTPPEKRDQVIDARKLFLAREGDHLTLLNVLSAYLENNASKEWCVRHYINARNMAYVMVCISVLLVNTIERSQTIKEIV